MFSARTCFSGCLRIGLAAVLLLYLLFTAVPVLADVAPPEQPPGSDLQPGEGTQVRMVSEEVIFTVKALPGKEEASLSNEEIYAEVQATFYMRNLGSADEAMRARFPMMNLAGWGDGWNNYPEIENFKISVDGKTVPWNKVPQQNPRGNDDPPINWAEFDVLFPVEQNVTLVVTYTVRPMGYYPLARFSYIFFTGAGWKDSIGSADLIVRLPYEASPENVVVEKEGGYRSAKGAELAGNEVRYHWDEYEPGEGDIWSCTILSPRAWQAVQDARANIKANAQDSAAWLALGRSVFTAAFDGKRGLRSGEGVEELVKESWAAFEKASQLDPKNASTRVELAQMLLMALVDDENFPKKGVLVERIHAEVDAIEALDPDSEDLPYIKDQLAWYVENFPVDTAVPTGTLPPPTATQAPVKIAVLPSETPTLFMTDISPDRVLTLYATAQTATARAETRVASGAASPRRTPACCPCPSAGLVLAAVAMAAMRRKLTLI